MKASEILELSKKSIEDLIVEFPFEISIEKQVSLREGIYYSVMVIDRHIKEEIGCENKDLRKAILYTYHQILEYDLI